ncbi:hypothetical protein [Synechococcus elongatus]|uniref:lysozyme n=1 Tax=Synechococcus elongatus TaxID=32046 RepID=UPI000F7D7A06|nr:hypothetical protein [Synechococcus elongatus]
MSEISREEFENFFKYFKGESHQSQAVGILYDSIDRSLLDGDSEWIRVYRKPPEPQEPVAHFLMELKRSASLLRGLFEIRQGSKRLLSVAATSGINPHQGPGDWSIKGAGPIPPFSGIRIDLDPLYLPQKGIEGNFYKILPFSFANGRGDFGVHFDANVPGTAGCIAILFRMDWAKTEGVFERLREQGFKTIPLSVSYGSSPVPAPSATPVQAPLSSLELALKSAKTTGASARTAAQDGLKSGGVASSRQLAQTDVARVRANLQNVTAGAKAYDLPVALVAAIASRESRVGNVLDANGWGDRGNGYGHMQVDKRYHAVDTSQGPGGAAHYRQACGIYASYLDQVAKKHPSWSMSDRIRGALVAYNSGMSNVQSIERADVGTTGGDYSADVIARAQYYQTVFTS